MKEEIQIGVEFLRQFLAKYGNRLTRVQIDEFAGRLAVTLHSRYVNHWYEGAPLRGQAFRCLRVKLAEAYVDPVLEQLLACMALTLGQLGLPNDFTLWIDPGEVSVRFGDQCGYTYTIAKTERKASLPQQQQSSAVASGKDQAALAESLPADSGIVARSPEVSTITESNGSNEVG